MPTIETTQEIEARADVVWEILADLDAYPEWNPFIIEAGGALSEGETLELTMLPPGGKPMTFKPKVLKVKPGRELRWFGRLLVPGLFDGEHWFRIEPTKSGVRLSHGERFSGLLPRFMGKTLVRTEAGFEALNQALKDRAESRRDTSER